MEIPKSIKKPAEVKKENWETEKKWKLKYKEESFEKKTKKETIKIFESKTERKRSLKKRLNNKKMGVKNKEKTLKERSLN